MKKIFVILALILSVSFVSDARKLVILHLNDTHSHFEPVRSGKFGGLGGTIERAVYVDSVRKAEGKNNVLLLHAGDFCQGTSYFTILKGEMEVETINAMKYDCVVLGNHEFDNGIEALTGLMKKVKCPVVCANYDFSSFELAKYVKPYAIVKRGGLKIGIIGLLTDITRVVDRTIADRLPKLDDVEVANKWAKYLKEDKKCDMVIALTHIGYEGELFTDPQLARQVKNIDLVVGGHSHTFLEEMKSEKDLDGNVVPIVQDGCWGLYIGKIEVEKN